VSVRPAPHHLRGGGVCCSLRAAVSLPPVPRRVDSNTHTLRFLTDSAAVLDDEVPDAGAGGGEGDSGDAWEDEDDGGGEAAEDDDEWMVGVPTAGGGP